MGLCWVESGKRERESGAKREKGVREERENILNNEMESYNNHAYLHSYCSIFVYAQCYRPTNMSSLLAKICKSWHFFYFPRIDALTKCFPKRNMTHKICCESVVKILCA